MILIPELYAILEAYFNENDSVSPIISVLNPPLAELQICIFSFEHAFISSPHLNTKSS